MWSSPGSFGNDSSGRSVQAQRFDANGVQIGLEFQVNTQISGDQFPGGAAAAEDGRFMLSYGPPELTGQMFDFDGDRLGAEFQINTYTTYSQGGRAIAVDGESRFVVAWQSYGSYGNDNGYDGQESVQVRRFTDDGVAVGNQFQVNTYTTNQQGPVDIAANPQGDFVVVWLSYGSSGSDSDFNSIHAQRLGFPINADGFDDGTFDGWDDVFPPPGP